MYVVVTLSPPDDDIHGWHATLPNHVLLFANYEADTVKVDLDLPGLGMTGTINIGGHHCLCWIPDDDAPVQLHDAAHVDVVKAGSAQIVTAVDEDTARQWQTHLDTSYREHAGAYRLTMPNKGASDGVPAIDRADPIPP